VNVPRKNDPPYGDEAKRLEELVTAARRAGVDDPRLLDVMRQVPRAAFVPLDQVRLAYLDVPVPIPHSQVTTQPSLSARMIQALGLAGVRTSLRSVPGTAIKPPCSEGWHRS
jgi:protein-L-isoaspartate O-methyltransferase